MRRKWNGSSIYLHECFFVCCRVKWHICTHNWVNCGTEKNQEQIFSLPSMNFHFENLLAIHLFTMQEELNELYGHTLNISKTSTTKCSKFTKKTTLFHVHTSHRQLFIQFSLPQTQTKCLWNRWKMIKLPSFSGVWSSTLEPAVTLFSGAQIVLWVKFDKSNNNENTIANVRFKHENE